MEKLEMSRQRDKLIEWLRVIAAICVVWYHSDVTGSYWGYSGLIVFLIMSMMFEAGPNIGRKTAVKSLALRLLLPWAFWWLIYAAINSVRHQRGLDMSNGLALGVLAGSRIHLWYLPFIFFALTVFTLVKDKLTVKVMSIGAAFLAMLTIWAIPFWRPITMSAGYPLAQWAHACVPIFIGILIGCGMRAHWPYALMLPVTGFMIWAEFRPFPTVALIYLIGSALVVGVLVLPLAIRRAAPDLGAIPGAMLGVYLVHPLALSIARPITDQFALVGVLVAFAVSLAGVLLAQWIGPWPSSLVLGTPMRAAVLRKSAVAPCTVGSATDQRK